MLSKKFLGGLFLILNFFTATALTEGKMLFAIDLIHNAMMSPPSLDLN